MFVQINGLHLLQRYCELRVSLVRKNPEALSGKVLGIWRSAFIWSGEHRSSARDLCYSTGETTEKRNTLLL